MKKTFLFSLLVAGMLTLASCGNAPKEETAGKHNIQLTKVTDYLYETTLDYDFEIADAQALYKKNKAHLGGCSSVSIGNLRGRNLDWVYGTGVEVVVRTPKTDKRHASLGIASLVNVSEEEANDGQNQEGCEMLPWVTVDGINDAGVCVNVNVVNYQELGPWEMKTETEDDDISELFFVRLILDNCAYLTEVVPLMEQYDPISLGTADECHFMVTGPRSPEDSTVTTVIFEQVPYSEGGKNLRRPCCISTDEKDIVLVGGNAERFFLSKADPFIMTNFNLWQFEADKDRKGRLLSATANPMGFERYETIEKAAQSALSVVGSKDSLTFYQMQDIMRAVYYTNNYNLSQPNYWYTEEMKGILTKEEIINATHQQRNPGGDINNILKGKDNKYFEHIKNLMVNRKQRDRNAPDNLWETIHTTIYNYKERSLQVNVHEGTIYYDYKL